MTTFFRLTTSNDPSQAFSGEGARKFGGRWNSKGTSLVYTAETLSLAVIEALVHVNSDELPPYYYYKIEAPDTVVVGHVESLPKGLPADWDALPAGAVSKALGDAWVKANKVCILRVPTAVIPEEHNFLVNPSHPDFSRLKIAKPKIFRFDPRLV